MKYLSGMKTMSLIGPPEQDQECFARLITDRFGLAFALSALLQALLGQAASFQPAARAVPVEHLTEHAGQRFPWSRPSVHTRSHNRRPSSGQPLVVRAC